jgi:diaminohydroxyphosphoribosylaminopyrimidine deaminase/5-amino-6-(5-phosphoribosylamino)uracil reductase
VTAQAKRDQRYMELALSLARRGQDRTAPNPMVGAVIVKGDRIVGRGYHRRCGAPHAEVVAIQAAGRAARGAELFVNLEPCDHVGLTGPCTQAIVQAGIRRVVVGMVDPNPQVNGKGIRALRRAGIAVQPKVLADRCRELNWAFVRYMEEGRPAVTFKTAITLDGRVATHGGHSRWVTSEQARAIARRLRNRHQGILVGVETVLADDPALDCRGLAGGRDPIRFILDTRLRTPPDARVVQLSRTSRAPTVILCGKGIPRRRRDKIEAEGARVIELPIREKRVDLRRALQRLAREFRLATLLVEGGPKLAGALWRRKLIDRVVAFIAPKIIGDPSALPMLWGAPVDRMSSVPRLCDVVIKRIGDEVMIDGRVAHGAAVGQE